MDKKGCSKGGKPRSNSNTQTQIEKAQSSKLDKKHLDPLADDPEADILSLYGVFSTGKQTKEDFETIRERARKEYYKWKERMGKI